MVCGEKSPYARRRSRQRQIEGAPFQVLGHFLFLPGASQSVMNKWMEMELQGELPTKQGDTGYYGRDSSGGWGWEETHLMLPKDSDPQLWGKDDWKYPWASSLALRTPVVLFQAKAPWSPSHLLS